MLIFISFKYIKKIVIFIFNFYLGYLLIVSSLLLIILLSFYNTFKSLILLYIYDI